MSVQKRRQISPSALCPDGSEWYTCSGPSYFAGCCKSNACIQNQCPSEDLMAVISSPASPSEFLDLSNADSSEGIAMDNFIPASSADSTDTTSFANSSDDIAKDIPEPFPHPPDESMNVPPISSSLASSAGLPYSPTATISTTEFTERFPFPPEGTPNVPFPPFPTPSVNTMATNSAIHSLSSRMTKIGAIAGAVGGLVILSLLCVIFMLYRRQKTSKNPSPTHVHEIQDMNRLEIDSRPCVNQLVGSPISELDSPSNAIHELPLPGFYHASNLRTIPPASKSDECFTSKSLTSSSLSSHIDMPIDRSSKL